MKCTIKESTQCAQFEIRVFRNPVDTRLFIEISDWTGHEINGADEIMGASSLDVRGLRTALYIHDKFEWTKKC